MASPLVRAHLEAQRRLRALAARGVERAWTALPSYDDAQVERWLASVLPLMDAAQRQSVLLTDAYVARSLERPPIGVSAAAVMAQVRRDVESREQWQRPFKAVWVSLSRGTDPPEAIAAGLARAASMAASDVQLSSWRTMQTVQDADPRIRGWQREANPGACAFCSMIDGAVVKSADAAPLHAGCGCALVPFTYDVEPTPLPEGVAVHEHGELGPVVADPAHDFTGPNDL